MFVAVKKRKPADDKPVVLVLQKLTDAKRALRSVRYPVGWVTAGLLWCWMVNAGLQLLQALLFARHGYRRRDFRRIVVYTVGILGDNAVMLPSLAALRRAYPNADITLLVNTQTWDAVGARELLDGLPFFNRWQQVNDNLLRRRGVHFVLDRQQVGDLRAELFINFSPFGNRGWLGAVLRELALAKKLGATHAVGFRVSGPRFALPWLICNEPRRGAEILAALGLTPEQECLPLNQPARDSIRAKCAYCEKLAVIHPGAKFKIQEWPAERFGKVASALAVRGFRPVVTGTAGEWATAEAVCRASDGVALNLAGQTSVAELVELLRMSALCVTNDTGTMHLAALLNVPTVALFTMRNSPCHWFPNALRVQVLCSPVSCGLCFLDGDDCPQHKRCLTNISVTDVIQATEKVWRNA